jgi:hypothetical protein
MTLKHLCTAAAVAGCLLSIGSPAIAQGSVRGGVTNSTSGALPMLPSSGALPQLPTSGALPSSPTLPIVGPSLGSTSTTLAQPPSTLPGGTANAPYQPPCGAYPLPQC